MAKLLIAPSRGSHNSPLTSGGGKTENYAGYVGHIGTFKQIDTYRYIRWRVEAWGAYRVGPIRSVASQRAGGYSRCGYSPRILAASILVFYAVLGAPSELRAYVTGIGVVALSRKAPSNLRIAKYSAITELAAAYVARVPRGARNQGCLWYAVSSGGQRMRGGRWWLSHLVTCECSVAQSTRSSSCSESPRIFFGSQKGTSVTPKFRFFFNYAGLWETSIEAWSNFFLCYFLVLQGENTLHRSMCAF